MSIGPVYIESIAVLGTGIPSWTLFQDILSGNLEYKAEALEIPKSALLSPRERRRTTETINYLLHISQHLISDSSFDLSELPSVFASSSGDPFIFDYLCNELAQPEPMLSPTHFHHSLHNSAAGYWSIAAKCMQSSTSICGYDASFSAGLIEAMTRCVCDEKPVLYVAYELPVTETLADQYPVDTHFAVGFVISNKKTKATKASINAEIIDSDSISLIHQKELQHINETNPMARSLPLLEAIALQKTQKINLEYLQPQVLQIDVSY